MKKRILSILLALCMVLMLVPVTAFAEEQPGVIIGDLNLDGEVTVRDAVHLQNYLEGLESFENLPEDVRIVADFNGDGVVDYSDLTKLQSSLELPESGITVTNGKATACDTEISEAAEGTRVTLTADSPSENMEFDQWIVNEGGVTLADASSATTTFTMPAGPVSVTATYKPLSVDETGSLAVTVDGFKVGNTPADCTYSFASTNMDVDFSVDDIQRVMWEGYFFYGDASDWSAIWETEVFEADTTYRLVMYLGNKGLATAPAVTVNGRTPEYWTIATRDGVPIQLQIFCTLDTPALPPITIDGPDVVCAQQDYEFTVTPPAGVTLDETFAHDTGYSGSDIELTIDEDGVGHGVVPAAYYEPAANGFDVIAHGTTAGGASVSASKHVEVSPEHIYVDGVCGCGAVQQYTVTYDGGEGSDPVTDVKTHGEDLTLRGETFTMDGFVQTGWVDGQGAEYDLGAAYTEDRDVTLYPVFEKIVTVTVPFTTTVALGDAGEPGETTFELALIDNDGEALTADNVTAAAAVTTDGAGDYSAAMTITGPEQTLWHLLSEGAFVRQVNAGEDGWTVDDTVWGVLMEEIPVAYAMGDDATASGYTVYVVPASIDEFGNYYIDWDNLETADMCFTNTYTAHAYALNHDADGHWDECAGCKDKRNEEPHRYGGWKVTKEATEQAAGEKEHTCTVCGYTEKVTIPVLEHTHDYALKHDATSHWDECDCGDIQNKEAHKYGDWKVIKKATETAKGEKEHTCTVCGYTEKAEIAKLAAKSDTTTPSTGDNSHVALWIALLCVSGAGVIGITVYVRKKKAK